MSKKYEHPPANRALGIHRARKNRILYLRKYVTGVGRMEISLRTTDLEEAEKTVFRSYSQFLRLPQRKAISVPVDDLVAEIYEINQGKAQRTFESFESTCRLHLLPYFTGMPIERVASEWPKYIAAQHKKSPDRQLGHDRKHLVTVLNRAVERELLPGLPKLKLDKAKRMRGAVSLFTREEIALILSVTPEQIQAKSPGNPDYCFKKATLDKLKLKVELGLFSGMRLPHEANALRFSDIDFKAGTATIAAGATKTRTGRTYPLDPVTLKKLAVLRGSAGSDFVFPRRGAPELPATRTDKTWQRFKRALGINKKMYWLRHTHATTAIEEGSSQTVVGKNMGTSMEMLDRIYVRPSQKAFERQAAAVRRRFSRHALTGRIGEIGEKRNRGARND